MNQREVNSPSWLPLRAIGHKFNTRPIKAALPLFITCLCLMACSKSYQVTKHDQTIQSREDLMPKVGQMVVLTGRYHDPGKGNRTLQCGFATFAIVDYSLKTRTADGFLIPEVKDGQKITVRARLHYFPGSRTPIEEGIKLQRAIDRTETIDGQTYIITYPAYSITEASLIKGTGKQR